MINPFKIVMKGIKNKRRDKQFLLRQFAGYEILVPIEKIDKLYGKTFISDSSKYGLRDVLNSTTELNDWCKQSKGIIRGDFVVGLNYQPSFQFSRREEFQEFKNKFLA